MIMLMNFSIFDMGFFEASVMGEGHDASLIITLLLLLMKIGTGIKLDVFHTIVTKKVVTSLLLRNYEVITCILAYS